MRALARPSLMRGIRENSIALFLPCATLTVLEDITSLNQTCDFTIRQRYDEVSPSSSLLLPIIYSCYFRYSRLPTTMSTLSFLLHSRSPYSYDIPTPASSHDSIHHIRDFRASHWLLIPASYWFTTRILYTWSRDPFFHPT